MFLGEEVEHVQVRKGKKGGRYNIAGRGGRKDIVENQCLNVFQGTN